MVEKINLGKIPSKKYDNYKFNETMDNKFGIMSDKKVECISNDEIFIMEKLEQQEVKSMLRERNGIPTLHQLRGVVAKYKKLYRVGRKPNYLLMEKDSIRKGTVGKEIRVTYTLNPKIIIMIDYL